MAPYPAVSWARALIASLFALAVCSHASAQPDESAAGPARPPLSALPKPARLELPAPSADALKRLDALLAKLHAEDAAERENAIRRIVEVDSDLIPAIHRRITTIAESSDREAMKRVLTRAREKLRKESKKKKSEAAAEEEDKGPDYVQMLHDHALPGDLDWKNVTSVVAMGRMLRQIGTTEAARQLVHIYVRFGEFLRVYVQRELSEMGDRSLAALIEAQRHSAEKVAKWASRQLDLKGKAIPSEVVQTEDFQVLADVLRAYGRNRDPDAARLIVSFANSERAQVRDAAREAVALMGEVAYFQLRDTFENIVGKKPPRDWSWERTARELFTEFDRLRLSQVYLRFEEGKKAQQDGDLEAMAAAFDKVLARSPLFEQRDQMAAGYAALGKKLLDEDPERAAAVLKRARRLAGDEATEKAIQSLLMTVEAELLLAQGVADQVLLRRASDLDPENVRARDLLDRVQRGDLEEKSAFNRYVASGAIGVVALAAIAALLLRKPKRGAPADAPGG